MAKIDKEVKKLNWRMEVFSSQLKSAVMREEISPVILDFTNAPEINEFVFAEGN